MKPPTSTENRMSQTTCTLGALLAIGIGAAGTPQTLLAGSLIGLWLVIARQRKLRPARATLR